MITTKKLFFLIIFVSCLLALAPSVVLADGGGNPQPPAGNYKYAPPPYKGNVTVVYAQTCLNGYTGCALLTGTLMKAGNEGIQCVLEDAIFEVGVQPGVFASHTKKDLQGRQIFGPSIGCAGFYEIIAAHSLFYNIDYTLFTVDLIVMEIVEKTK